jgi:cobalt-zinc-cadmium efflux system outer membrane protein
LSFLYWATRFGVAGLAVALTAGTAAAQFADAPPLRLEDAFARALNDAPALEASEQARRAAEAGVRQADRAVNPTLELGAENFGGWSSFQWIERTESTLSYSQALEMGGDREARTQLAGAGVRARMSRAMA